MYNGFKGEILSIRCNKWRIKDFKMIQRICFPTEVKLIIFPLEKVPNLFDSVELEIDMGSSSYKFSLVIYSVEIAFEEISLVLYHPSKVLEETIASSVFVNKKPSEIIKTLFPKINSKHIDLDEKIDVCIRFDENSINFMERMLYGRGYWQACNNGEILIGKNLGTKVKIESIRFNEKIYLVDEPNLLVMGFGDNPNLRFSAKGKSIRYQEIFSPIFKNKPDGKILAEYSKKKNNICYSFEISEYLKPFDIITDNKNNPLIVYETIHELRNLKHSIHHQLTVSATKEIPCKNPKIPYIPAMVATVMASDKETIFVDKKHNILVSFPFDKMCTKTPALLAETFANQNIASSFVPPVNSLVLVQWYEGKPIVIGSLYNEANQPVLDKKETGIKYLSHDGKNFKKNRFSQLSMDNSSEKERFTIKTPGTYEAYCNNFTLKVTGEKQKNSYVIDIKDGNVVIGVGGNGTILLKSEKSMLFTAPNLFFEASKNIVLKSKNLTIDNEDTIVKSNKSIQTETLTFLSKTKKEYKIDSTKVTFLGKIFKIEAVKFDLVVEAVSKFSAKALQIKCDLIAEIKATMINFKANANFILDGAIVIIKASASLILDSAAILMIKSMTIIMNPAAAALLMGACIAASGMGIFRIGLMF